MNNGMCFAVNRESLSGTGSEGRKRRSDMNAPVPVGKEALNGEPDKPRTMVTLRRGGKTSATTTATTGAPKSTDDGKKVAAASASSSAGGKAPQVRIEQVQSVIMYTLVLD